jgi:5-methyltetrahydropteroyltriglutamate--homocysteine methyltransferase
MPQPLHTLLPTSLVGSYPQPDWLVDRDNLRGRFPPRVRAKELWRVDPRFLEEAQDDATIVAIRDQERAGLDIVTDGEMRRESYSNRFATALEGIDIDNPGSALDRSGHPNPVPRIAGKIRRKYPVQVRDMEFLRRNTTRMVKMTVPGPFTMSQQAQNDFYRSPAEAAMDYAKAVNEEIKDLFAAGADVVQIDEPYMQARPQAAREYGLRALEAALDGVKGTTAVHICFGYAAIIHARPEGYSFLPEFEQCRVHQVSIETAQSNLDTAILEKLPDKTIVLGVIDLDNLAVETPDVVASRITRAFPHCPPERIIVAPDCGMKYLPREVAYGKMVSMVKGAAMVRDALASARSAVDKSQKKKAAAAPEIRIAARTAARTAAKAKPAKAAAKPAKAAKPASRPKAKAKGKAGKKR